MMEEISWFRAFLYRHCVRPKVLQIDEDRRTSRASAILILSKHPNPTFSYYLEERIAALENVPVTVRDINQPLEDVDPAGLFVIICRYVKPRHLRWLERQRDQMAGIAYFVDDDVAAIIAGPEARLYYKWKLFRMAIRPLSRLNHLVSDVWASTEALAATLRTDSAVVTVLPPYPPEIAPMPVAAPNHSGALTMIYHATAIHRQEHAFLIPIVEAAMRRHENLQFQVVADGDVAGWWHDARIDKERLNIRPPLSWSAYAKAAQAQGGDIALIPLLDSRINNARSDTKRIDIVRSGAAAIFSHCDIYQRCAVQGESHVANTAADWGDAIDLLVRSDERRLTSRNATRKSIELMRQRASPKFPGLSFAAGAVRKSS